MTPVQQRILVRLHRSILLLLLAAVPALGGCRSETANGAEPPVRAAGRAVAVREVALETFVEAIGRAVAFEEATLSTRLMGQVLEVTVREGDRVAAGALLVRIDAADLAARRRQVEAQLAQAEAARREAELTTGRLRALLADSAAPRAQVDAAEAALARAVGAVAQAQGARAEVDAMSAYAEIRAPFGGTVTRRFVDPGAFAAPGAPLLTLQNSARLRVAAAAGPETLRGVRRGAQLDVLIESEPVRGTVEGVVPGADGRTWTVNVIVDNAAGALMAQSAATLLLPAGRHTGLVVPDAALRRDGDLASVLRIAAGTTELRWVRLGRRVGADVEIVAGLTAGDSVVGAAAAAGGR